MKVTLIHNPTAGNGDRSDADVLTDLIRAAGHQVRYRSSKEKGWQAALEKPTDLVAVAGGDGTVGKVSRLLVGKDVPVAVLPQGTANNIPRALNLSQVPHQQLIAGWTGARHLAFDVGVARGPWGQEYFLESLGTGLFAWTLARLIEEDMDTFGEDEDKDIERELQGARRFLREQLQEFVPRSLKIDLDGKDLSGEYLLVEAMNIRCIGPNLFLAPAADHTDGYLDVVLVSAKERDQLNEHFRDQSADTSSCPVLPSHRGRHLQIQTMSTEFHLDDRQRPAREKPSAQRPISVDVSLDPGTVIFLGSPLV